MNMFFFNYVLLYLIDLALINLRQLHVSATLQFKMLSASFPPRCVNNERQQMRCCRVVCFGFDDPRPLPKPDQPASSLAGTQ